MANVVCRKCGATADSKCPYCRNIFLDSRDLAILETVMPSFIETDKDNPRKQTVIIRRQVFDGLDKTLDDIIRCLEYVRDQKMTEQFFCAHVWELADGCSCELGCHQA